MNTKESFIRRLAEFGVRSQSKSWLKRLKEETKIFVDNHNYRQISVSFRKNHKDLYSKILAEGKKHGIRMINGRIVHAILFGVTSSTCKNPHCGNSITAFTDYFRYKHHCSEKCAGYSRHKNAKQVIKQRYGVDHVAHIPGVNDKRKATCQKKYGVPYTSLVKSVQAKMKETRDNRTIEAQLLASQRRIKTWERKYGVDHPMKLPSFKEAAKQRALNRTAEERSASTEKSRKTRIEKYGVFTPPSALQKARKTYRENSGYSHPLQNPEVVDRMLSKRYQRKIIFDHQKKKHSVQGYEHHVINRLKEKHKPKAIFSTAKDVGGIHIQDGGRESVYFPDLRIILSDNSQLVIEVKSSFTIGFNPEKNYIKFSKAEKQLRARGIAFKIALVHSADDIETLSVRQWKRRYYSQH